MLRKSLVGPRRFILNFAKLFTTGDCHLCKYRFACHLSMDTLLRSFFALACDDQNGGCMQKGEYERTKRMCVGLDETGLL